MAEADVELARRSFDAFADEGVEGLIRFLHPDFEMTPPRGLAPEPDTSRGHDGIRRYFTSFYDVMDDISFDIDEFEDLGSGLVMGVSRVRARGQATGIGVEQEVPQVCEMEDGLVRRIHVFRTPEQARAAFQA